MEAAEFGLFDLPDDALATIGHRERGYYGVHHGYEGSSTCTLMARMYRNAMPSLSFVAPHVRRLRRKRVLVHQISELPEPDVIILRRRVRVGFRTSSIGTLMNGMIRGLSRDKFVVFLILDGPSTTDELSHEVATSVEHVVTLNQKLKQDQQVARLELDVLEFTEILHPNVYFLAFAQLALRTAMLRNHAKTSGIDSIDYIISPDSFDFPRQERPDTGDLSAPPQLPNYSACVYPMHTLSASTDTSPPLLSGY